MARKVRVFIKNSPHLLVIRPLKDLIIFQDNEDFKIYLKFIKESKAISGVNIHSYFISNNAIWFLLTPQDQNSISKFMQSLGRKYVRYYNQKYSRTGTIWEGRYRSSLVQEKYLFTTMIYIETQNVNPNYSSKEINLNAKSSDIVTFHSLYKSFGYTPNDRSKKYRELFNKGVDKDVASFIDKCLQSQSIIGSKDYIKNLEEKLGLALLAKKRGRPKKNQNKGRKMYKNLIVLDKEKHKDLKVKPMQNLEFAKNLTYIPVAANEIELIAKDFPIVFTADENPSLIAIISLGENNLALSEDNKWITNYVPQFIRRYPFSLASTNENKEQKIVLIDEDSELFSTTEGEALFNENGEATEILSHAINFLNSYDNNLQITKNISKLFSDSGILEDREITVGEGDEKKVLVKGFRVVNRDKLNELSDDILADWVRKGIITFIDTHLKSLNNIQKLFDLTMQKQNIK